MAYTAAPERWWQDFVGGETARTAKLAGADRNGVPGELLVRVPPEQVVARVDITN
jgi:hypothetical protein